MRILGNIVCQSDVETNFVISIGLLQWLSTLIEPNVYQKLNQKLKKEVLWIISNIAAGTKDQVNRICLINIPKRVIDIIFQTNDKSILTEGIIFLFFL